MRKDDMYYSLKDKDLIVRTALETGYYHKPKFYKEYIKEHFDRDVSSAHIVKTLGTFKMRIKRLDYQIALRVQELLDMARNDLSLVNNIIKRVWDERQKRSSD
jgi:hypothetical protein